MATSNTNVTTSLTTTTMQSFLEQNKLTETNYVHWLDNLRLLLKQQGKLYVLDGPVPNKPLDINATNNTAVKGAHEKHAQDNYDVGCLMLAAMSPHLQKMMVRVDAYQINVTLKKMFQHLVRQERFVTSSAFFSCKMAEGASVSSHLSKMKGYIDRLDRLGYPLDQELATDVILNSLSKDYGQFVTNYVNGSMDKSISELQLMLTAVEMNIVNVVAVPKQPNHDAAPPMVVGASVVGGKVTKKAPENKGNTQKAKKPYADAICHHCNETGHWKRNCKLYLEDVNFKKAFCTGQMHTTN